MEKKKLGIKGNLVDDIKMYVFKGKQKVIKVYNFKLVKKYGKGREYINCSFYGDKMEKFNKGDLIYAFGSFQDRKKLDKTYKNFIVEIIEKINK